MPAENFRVRLRVLLVCALVAGMLAPASAKRAHLPATGLATVRYNQAPPDFVLPVGSRRERLSALVGTPVVINFWATWCRPCVEEMPAFEKMLQRYGERVRFVTLSFEPAGTAQAFLRAEGLDFPLLEDPRQVVFGLYSVHAYPVTVVVGRSGQVVYVSNGELDWPELQSVLDLALAGGS